MKQSFRSAQQVQQLLRNHWLMAGIITLTPVIITVLVDPFTSMQGLFVGAGVLAVWLVFTHWLVRALVAGAVLTIPAIIRIGEASQNSALGLGALVGMFILWVTSILCGFLVSLEPDRQQRAWYQPIAGAGISFVVTVLMTYAVLAGFSLV